MPRHAYTATGVLKTEECVRPGRRRAGLRLVVRTGGLHAAGLFDLGGSPIQVREDVGRHNAVDELVGWSPLQRRLPLATPILVVSGRVSYEIVQKALLAGIRTVAAVSAPTARAGGHPTVRPDARRIRP